MGTLTTVLGLMTACGAREASAPSSAATTAGKAARRGTRDGSRCEYEGRADREVSETISSGSLAPNIRRVYHVTGEGEQRRRTLVCREVDTNIDGVKDVFRTYDARGGAIEEQADSNYDGVIDTWVRFDKGQIIQVEVDDAWDGQPDEKRHYVRGKLTRIERDTNGDGQTDVWEYYVAGRLDRIGVDLNYDGRVERWSRDATAERTTGSDSREGRAASAEADGE